MPLQVAEPWYETRSAGDGVTLVDECHVDPLARSNIWLVTGRDRAFVVDTGTGCGPLRELAERLAGGRPVTAFATLGYYDHAGGLHQFDERIIHAADADRVARPTPRKVASGRYVGWAFRALPRAGFDPRAYAVPPSVPTRTVAEGDVIDLGDRRFEAIHLPGITAGTCGLLERSTGHLFTGDALIHDRGWVYDGEPRPEFDDADPAAFRASLERLRELPVSRVFPGHYAPFDRATMLSVIEDYLAGRTLAAPGQ